MLGQLELLRKEIQGPSEEDQPRNLVGHGGTTSLRANNPHVEIAHQAAVASAKRASSRSRDSIRSNWSTHRAMAWHTWTPIGISAASFGLLVIERVQRRKETSDLRKRLERSEIAHLEARQQDAKHVHGGEEYVFSVTNAGPAVARDVVAQICEIDELLRPFSVNAVEEVKLAIPVGGEVLITMKINTPQEQASFILSASWSDDHHRHTDERLLSLKRPPKREVFVEVW